MGNISNCIYGHNVLECFTLFLLDFKYILFLWKSFCIINNISVVSCPYDYTAVAMSGEIGTLFTRLTTPVGWLLFLQLTVLKSIRNRCVIEVFDGVQMYGQPF